jgi:hypothetical protein
MGRHNFTSTSSNCVSFTTPIIIIIIIIIIIVPYAVSLQMFKYYI